ncbi:hypothetical protein XENOCAPTIV_017260 [Xenoophorus captivus]|uniref:Borealin C-terminal domain-containing protein n=1 Tax=Xenoophorus captivus TaxID=1517983 RepID=A0ABV0QSB0_9TELE
MAPRKRTTKQRKNNPKTAKLEVFLEDFDSEGEDVLHLPSSPKCSGCVLTLQLCFLSEQREKEAAIVESVVAEDHAVLLKSVKKSQFNSALSLCCSPLWFCLLRLPKTPAVRLPCHKERVYSISVNGSPIAAGSEDIIINVPVGNGESIQLLASEMDSMDLNLLDETALRSIRLLKVGSSPVQSKQCSVETSVDSVHSVLVLH